MNKDRWYVRQFYGKVYGCPKNQKHWEVIDSQTGERVYFDLYHEREVAVKQAAIYNEQGGPKV